MLRILVIFILLQLVNCKSLRHQVKTNPAAFKLENITFHTSACHGFCPTYHLQIDSLRQFKLHAEQVYLPGYTRNLDSNKIGYFTGVVDDSSYAWLTGSLETIGLDSLKFDDITCCDAPIITLVILYNGKRKFLRSMIPPEKATYIIYRLNWICQNSRMKRSRTAFKIDEPEQ